MTSLRDAAQAALEALEGGADSWQRVGPAIDALKAALTEPVQEPVAHKHEWFSTGAMEPGKMRCIHCGIWNHEAAPPQRKPLTTEQILDLFDSHNVYGTKWVEFARAVERAHGIGDDT